MIIPGVSVVEAERDLVDTARMFHHQAEAGLSTGNNEVMRIHETL